MNGPEMAERLGLQRAGTTWRGQCPACGYGALAFALTAKAGRVCGWCASCGDRDAIAAVLARLHCGAAVRLPDTVAATSPTASTADRTAAALAVWNGAVPATGTPADRYLSGRALPGLAASPALRWRPDVAHPAGGARHPALVGLVVDVAGRPIAVHRTYLTGDGSKADLLPVKASKGPLAGGAIRLNPAAAELVVGEGIETAASAGRLLGLPAWAAVSAGNMGKSLMLPPEVRRVVIAGDPDPAGRRAAADAAQRWRTEGRTVRIAMPNNPPQDFNDLLMVAVHG